MASCKKPVKQKSTVEACGDPSEEIRYRPDQYFGVCAGLKQAAALLGELTLRLFLLLNILITFCNLIVDDFDLYS